MISMLQGMSQEWLIVNARRAWNGGRFPDCWDRSCNQGSLVYVNVVSNIK